MLPIRHYVLKFEEIHKANRIFLLRKKVIRIINKNIYKIEIILINYRIEIIYVMPIIF